MLQVIDTDMRRSFNRRYHTLLDDGLHSSQLIDVTGLRRTGKTTALIEFARERNIPVVEPNQATATMFRRDYGYRQIYGVSELRGRDIPAVVIDENVEPERVREMGINILTGYHTYM